MGARDKLNQHHVYAAIGVATVFGLLTQSLSVFVVAIAVMIGASLYLGEIRPGRGRRR